MQGLLTVIFPPSMLRECAGSSYKSRFEKHGARSGFPELFFRPPDEYEKAFSMR
jgi:hypothetical protein